MLERKPDRRSLRDQCKEAGVAYFLKQARCELEEIGLKDSPYSKGAKFVVCGGDGSKKKSGGIFELPYLDGFQHAEFPTTEMS